MMTGHLVLGILVSALPILALFALFVRLDRIRPTPRRLYVHTMLLGALMCLPTAWLERFARSMLGNAVFFGGHLVDAYLVIALLEESVKLIVVLAYPYRRRDFAEVIDGVVFSAAASLGFGLLENLLYADQPLSVVILRALTAVPMHAITAGIMGYYVGRARFLNPHAALPYTLAGLGLAVLIHGTYDWITFLQTTAWPLQIVLLLTAAAVGLTLLVRRAVRHDEATLGRPSLPTSLSSQWPTDATDTLLPAPPTIEKQATNDKS